MVFFGLVGRFGCSVFSTTTGGLREQRKDGKICGTVETTKQIGEFEWRIFV